MASKLVTPSNIKSLKLTVRGLDEYVERIAKAGNSIDEAVAEAVEEIKEGVRDDIQVWADKHNKKHTGATARSVNSTDVKRDGNTVYAEVGIDTNVELTGWHAVFVEYGTPTNPADPGIRRTFKKWKGKQKSIFKRVFEKWGLPHV